MNEENTNNINNEIPAVETIPEISNENVSVETPIPSPADTSTLNNVATEDRPQRQFGNRDNRGGAGGGFRGGMGGARGPGGAAGRGRRPAGGRPERQKPEFEQKMIDVRRVTRVVSGGRRFSFSVALVIGDRKGHVGFGIGKSGDTSAAIDKAYKQASKKMITLRLNKNFSIPYDVKAKFNTSRITLMPNKGRGLIAGSSARTVLALAGAKDITAKYHSGSKNKLNNAKAAMEALRIFSVPFERSHKPKEDRTADVRKFIGRDSRDGRDGDRPGFNRGGLRPRAPFRKPDDAPKPDNPIDNITV